MGSVDPTHFLHSHTKVLEECEFETQEGRTWAWDCGAGEEGPPVPLRTFFLSSSLEMHVLILKVLRS